MKKSIEHGFEPANLGSRGEHVTPKPPRSTSLAIKDKLFYFCGIGCSSEKDAEKHFQTTMQLPTIWSTCHI